MVSGDLNDLLGIYTTEAPQVAFKDVTLMDSTKTFSKQFSKEDFIVKELELASIEVAPQKNNPSPKLEQVAFDLD